MWRVEEQYRAIKRPLLSIQVQEREIEEADIADLDYMTDKITQCSIGKRIGQGASANVKRVYCPFVLKVTLRTDEQKRQQAINEVRLLKILDHPNVMYLIASMVKEEEIRVLLPFAAHGDLTKFNVINGKEVVVDHRLQNAFKQVYRGLLYLRRQLIVHRDIKPANILVFESDLVKISDFGISTRLRKSTDFCLTQVGTVRYMSLSRLHGNQYSFDADLWSLGVIIMEAVLCKSYDAPPFSYDEPAFQKCTSIDSYLGLSSAIKYFRMDDFAAQSNVSEACLQMAHKLMYGERHPLADNTNVLI